MKKNSTEDGVWADNNSTGQWIVWCGHYIDRDVDKNDENGTVSIYTSDCKTRRKGWK